MNELDILPPDQFQTLEVPCKICKRPVRVRVAYEAPDKDVAGLLAMAAHNACYDQRMATIKAGEEAEKAKARALKFETLCPQEFQRPINFKVKGCNPKLYDKVMAHSFKEGRGLCLIGRTGLCKTRFAWALLKREMLANGRTLFASTHTKLRQDATLMAAEGGKACVTFTLMITSADIWFVDDLGKGRNTNAAEELFEHVLDLRTSKHRPCVFTSNETPASLAGLLSEQRGEAILRRMQEFCEVIEF